MTKKAEYYYKLLQKYHDRSIYDCYENPSITKINTYYNLLEDYYNDYDVIAYGITSYNTFQFTLTILLRDKTTKEKILVVETTQNTYKFKID